MNQRILKIGSVTYAHKARNLLLGIGIRGKIQKLSSHAQGCVYGIEFPEEMLYTVMTELEKANISYEVIHTR